MKYVVTVALGILYDVLLVWGAWAGRHEHGLAILVEMVIAAVAVGVTAAGLAEAYGDKAVFPTKEY